MPRVDPETRRGEILEAAKRSFAKTGYHGTSMDDIVAESGLSKGTLYWYFDNKQALFMAMLESMFGEMAAMMADIVAQEGSASERLRGVASLFMTMMVAEKELGDLVVSLWVESRHDETFNAAFREAFQPYIDALVTLIEQGIENGEFGEVNAPTVASAIAGMFDGLWLQVMIGLPMANDIDSNTLVDWMLDGLRPR